MNLLLIFLVAVSLSMDAFSMSIAYGTYINYKKDIFKLCIIVGIYHFIMPIIGMNFGKKILSIIKINPSLITLLIFIFIGINMVLDSFKECKVKQINFKEFLLFGLAVSIDSFSIGIGINNISNNYIICSIIFSIVSFIFTLIGLIIGNKLNSIIGKISTILGGIMLIILGIMFSL